MPIRLKKLIGTILLVLLVVIYAMVATVVAVAQFAPSVDSACHGDHQMANHRAATKRLTEARHLRARLPVDHSFIFCV